MGYNQSMNLALQRWQKKNPEKVKEHSRISRLRNKDKIKIRSDFRIRMKKKWEFYDEFKVIE